MKKLIVASLILVMGGGFMATAAKKQPKQAAPAPVAAQLDSVSYALGMSVGYNFTRSGVENININDFVAGLSAILKGETPRLTDNQAEGAVNSYFAALDAKRRAEAAKVGEANAAKGKSFLDENGKRAGVQTTPSGLQYEVLAEGTGEQPTSQDRVTVHYTGKLIDGTVFDSSVERGEPVTFGVTQVIPGWTEALQLMKKGAKYRLYIPSNLAYGPNGAGGVIGPNETLIFDVELIDIPK